MTFMFASDDDPGEQPRPDEEPSPGLDTEDELAEDLTPSSSQGLEIEDQLEGQACGEGATRTPLDLLMALPPEDEEDSGGGLETEDETRSPRGLAWLLEPRWV